MVEDTPPVSRIVIGRLAGRYAPRGIGNGGGKRALARCFAALKHCRRETLSPTTRPLTWDDVCQMETGMGTRVVVVEDEPGVRDLLGDILEMEGCDPLCFEHPSLVRNIPQDPPPDLFLIDLMLPEMSGIELAAELRKRGYGRTPMVAMSASSRLLDAARAADLFQDTLAKPFDVREMVGTIHRYLR